MRRFLEADGLLEDEVVLSSPPDSHFATVFQLCYRTRVNAADELIVSRFGELYPLPVRAFRLTLAL